MNEPDFSLEQLLDDAANGFHPTLDVARMERTLVGHHRRRGLIVIGSAAACLALVAGGAFAFRSDSTARVSPMQSEPGRTTEPRDTEPKTTEPRATEPKDTEPKDTEPDGTEPKDTEPDTTEVPTGPTTTERRNEPPSTNPPKTDPPKTDPPVTEPHATDPPKTDPPVTEPPVTEPPIQVEWSAFQVYGTCDATPPFEVFYGTAQPGSIVLISSPYGGRDKLVGENGHWEVKVFFPDAPVGEPFQVWVTSGDHKDDFWFTRVSPG